MLTKVPLQLKVLGDFFIAQERHRVQTRTSISFFSEIFLACKGTYRNPAPYYQVRGSFFHISPEVKMSQLKIPLLTGHPFVIPVSVAERSVYELVGDRLGNCVQKTGPVQLMHPPVLLKQEGGGEVLLNLDSLIAQLKNGSDRPLVPSSVVTWVIETETVPAALLRFVFGPLQRMYYQTKHMNGELLWRANMRQLWNDPFLRSCVEESFFDGVTLESRHYKQLMSPLKLSSRSIDGQLALLRSQSEVPQDDLQNSEPSPAEQTMQPDESGVPLHSDSDATPHCGDTEKKSAEQQRRSRFWRYYSPEYTDKKSDLDDGSAHENSEDNEQ